MYTIQNKRTTLQHYEKNKAPRDSFYADLIITCMNVVGRHGVTTTEQRKRFQIIDKMEAALKNKSKSIDVDDEQFEIIKECVAATPWITMSRELPEFEDHIASLKPDQPKKK